MSISSLNKQSRPTQPIEKDNLSEAGPCESFTWRADPAGAQKELAKAGVTAEDRNADLFQQRPTQGYAEMPDGTKHVHPWENYDGDMNVWYGTGNPQVAEKLLKGTGYSPVLTSDGRALYELAASKYRRNSLGENPYSQIQPFVLGSKTPMTIPWVNPYSAVAAALTPGVRQFQLPLFINSEKAKAWGVDVGLEKHVGDVDITSTPEGDRAFSATDVDGKTVLKGSTTLNPQKYLEELPQFAAALGIPVEAMANLPPIIDQHSAFIDMHNGIVRDGTFAGQFSPQQVYNIANESTKLEFGDGGKVGPMMRAVEFEPQVTWGDPHAKTMYSLVEREPAPAAADAAA